MLIKRDNVLVLSDGNKDLYFYPIKFYRRNVSSRSVNSWNCLISDMEYEILSNLSDDALMSSDVILEIINRETDEDKANAYTLVYTNVVKKLSEKKQVIDEMVNSINLD